MISKRNVTCFNVVADARVTLTQAILRRVRATTRSPQKFMMDGKCKQLNACTLLAPRNLMACDSSHVLTADVAE